MKIFYIKMRPTIVDQPYPQWLWLENLNKIESNLPEDGSTQVIALLVNWFLRSFLQDTNKFSIILNRLSSEEDLVLRFTKFKSHSLKDALCKVFF